MSRLMNCRAACLVSMVVSGIWSVNADIATAQETKFSVTDCVYHWSAAYHRMLPQVTVRIKLVPSDKLKTPLADLQQRWRDGIRDKWSDHFACRNGEPRLQLDVQWVDNNEHHVVTVLPGRGRAKMTTWYERNDGNTIAHEFGHMLGMRDEYADPHCPSRHPVDTGTVMANVKGPIEQRYIDAVCAGGPEPPPDRAKQAAGKDQPARKPVGKITADDLTQPLIFRLIVSGGPPGDRLEYTVTANPSGKSLQYTYLDEMKQAEKQRGEGALSGAAIDKLLTTIREGSLPPTLIGGPFVPGSMVASLTIETAEKQQILRYGLDEASEEPWPVVDLKSLPRTTEQQRAAVTTMHQALTAELIAALRPK